MNLFECEKLLTDALNPLASKSLFYTARNMLENKGAMKTDERLLVYRHNISGVFIQTLASTFMTCEAILGHACFATYAREYGWSREKKTGDLNAFGEEFPAYILKQVISRHELNGYAYLADLAKLEWLIEKSRLSDDDDHNDLVNETDIVSYDPGTVYPVLTASLQLLKSQYTVFDIWQLHKQSEDRSGVFAIHDMDYLSIHRDSEDDVIIQKIDSTMFNFLTMATKGVSLLELAGDAPVKMMQCMSIAIQRGWCAGFRIDVGEPNDFY